MRPYHTKADKQCPSHMSELHVFLLSGAPPPGVHKRSESLHRGLNFVTVCVTLSAALMGYRVVRQPLWIEGKQIQPGVNVLSGPFDVSQISSHVTSDTTPSNNGPFYNERLVDLPETPDPVWEENVPNICVTYCTTSAVESKSKKISIPENVILGDMTIDDDAVLKEALLQSNLLMVGLHGQTHCRHLLHHHFQ